jgi:hypothetical protein
MSGIEILITKTELTSLKIKILNKHQTNHNS